MGEIEVRLKESYVNEFLTTVTGYIIRHKIWTKVNDADSEIRQLLNQGQILEVKGAQSLREKIIMDSPPKDTLKGTITTKSLESNEKTIEKIKGENKMSEEENPSPTPEEQPKPEAQPEAEAPAEAPSEEEPAEPEAAPAEPEAPAEEAPEAEAKPEEAPAEEPKAEEEPKPDDNPAPSPSEN